MDILQEHLVRARAAGGVFARSIAVAPWGLRLPGTIQLAVHAVIQGHAWLWLDGGGEPVELRPGDLALVRGGPDHFIAHEPGAHCVLPEDFQVAHASDEAERDPRASAFLCGAYRFAGDIGVGLVNALPPVFLIPSRMDNPIQAVVALLSRELSQSEPGRQTVLDRLLDVLVVLGLRTGLTSSPNAPAWVRGASDARLSKALQAMHGDTGKPWTVEELARMSHMSRATFARVFQEVLGDTPMRYLTDWRMTVARDLLRTQDVPLTEVAERVGYSSLYAFATAFRRHHGQPPGRWRQSGQDLPEATLTH
ncbi:MULTISPECIES: AraC family transcriptional regulator [Pseudomonadota]|jgi:AraC-like DNA-binding protein|uniref:AraC family transcriptional regulator n=1 Tax=Roseateles depolymerans TaxID=76731 RepID=A0A2W5D8L4_9BURK|nr:MULTISPECIES: AraC family transcriptional regulator [Pseudomonadota]EGT3595204.1 AraC family transcriptional regulator [Serratia marcescens]PZP26868.1 MAG: AraC family transcriptional regulator [Roseateles depolymerans]MBG6839882.1 AraC family transcriptional regulator [Pseudomonas aeruginosa]MBG7018463.1 AraC family transcriptional regulator [Pseudomonas aeruginosa]MCA3190090.1 AraC family transcriptional regulator [Cupriavidus sp.]